ncbi:TerD family protein [Nocardioides acrostichi]|uniref:Tellurium resistance n=1 Tax=Nocardioides acrostichi TaxID=2784339 RepID=A0A930V2F9_9ACTN|nr:Tellurium resistance [Nocardioides acrostichi]MBF4162661.1 Tellurium resistance [Nocardioides acrostichi]
MSDGVNLSKVTLTKSSPQVSLAKQSGASGRMRVNLNWDQRSSGGFFKRSQGVDLDLGCLFELTDGSKGVVQALGRAFGALDAPPYVQLDGDDRSGTNTAGENLVVNLDHLDRIKRIVVFAYIYEGAPAWDKAQGTVTLYPQGAAPIEVRLDEPSGLTMCGVALLTHTDGALSVERTMRYVRGHRDLDESFGWGLNWTAGRK